MYCEKVSIVLRLNSSSSRINSLVLTLLIFITVTKKYLKWRSYFFSLETIRMVVYMKYSLSEVDFVIM